MEYSLLLLAFALLCFGPKIRPGDGLVVVYGCPGNWHKFRTHATHTVTVQASNGPAVNFVYGVISVPLYPTVQLYYTNAL